MFQGSGNKFAKGVSLVGSFLAAILLVALMVICVGARPACAHAQTTQDAQPSVLLIDASLGDFQSFQLHWLNESTVEVARNGSVVLLSADNPLWWGSADGQESTPAPATFLLGCDDANAPVAVTSENIAWALQKVAESGAQAKSVVVSVGCSGLQARQFAEDLSSTKQSAYANLVGMVFCGTPQNGFSVSAAYPKVALWNDVANKSGLEPSYLLPGSEMLNSLNGTRLPSVVKVLEVAGNIGDMGFGVTDGVSVEADMTLSPTVSGNVTHTQSRATLSQAVGLSKYWHPYAVSEDNQGSGAVDAGIAERLSAMESYVSSPDVREKVKNFYLSWFSDGSPVTAVSSALAIDVSGSMLERLDGVVKIDAAKSAAAGYLQAMNARLSNEHAVPADVSVVTFDTAASVVAKGCDTGSQAAVRNIRTGGDTDINLALTTALRELQGSPLCSSKHILLLSDGANTAGLTTGEILSGVVAQAAAEGIAIDTVALGDGFTESDIAFLQEISDATGGTLYESTDEFGLRRDFLRSYYSSLGLSMLDQELPSGSVDAVPVGAMDNTATSLELGVITDGATALVHVLKDGEEVDASLYDLRVSDDGLVTVLLENPAVGNYSVRLDGGDYSRAHVFAVGQLDRVNVDKTAGEAQDYSLLLLIAAAVVMVGAIAATVVFGLRKKKA
ncbi:MAG: vWA domain-containing protein [Coriobacteriia bacterium]|nr:vWA domain-containing protein [Coriobacteriia bacterium]